MQYSLQAFFLGICAAALSLILLVAGSLLFSLVYALEPGVRDNLFIWVVFGVIIEESIRVLMLYGFWHRRSITSNLPFLGALMGMGFALCEIILRLISRQLSLIQASELIGLGGIFVLHSLLGLLSGFLAIRLLERDISLLRPLYLFLVIIVLCLPHLLYNLVIISWISPLLNGV